MSGKNLPTMSVVICVWSTSCVHESVELWGTGLKLLIKANARVCVYVCVLCVFMCACVWCFVF